MKLTPNIKKLIIHKSSMDAIPPGGDIADGVKFLTEPGRLVKSMRDSSEWVDAVILAVRYAGEPNPWKSASDEEIAGEILRRIEKRRAEKLTPE